MYQEERGPAPQFVKLISLINDEMKGLFKVQNQMADISKSTTVFVKSRLTKLIPSMIILLSF